jgi:hypothetical protein
MDAPVVNRQIAEPHGCPVTRAVGNLQSHTFSNPAKCRAGAPTMTLTHRSTALLAQERRQFRLIFGVAFVVFLAITLVARLLPRRLRPWAPVGDRRLSLVAEARAVTNTVIPFAFL